MAITISYKRQIAFSKNPYIVVVRADESDLTSDNGVYRLQVTVGGLGENIFLYFVKDGSNYRATLDLSQYAQLVAHPVTAWEAKATGSLFNIPVNTLANYVARLNIYTTRARMPSIYFLKGGLSRKDLRIANSAELNAIDTRLMLNFNMFLATTRYNGSDVYFYKSELYSPDMLPFLSGDTAIATAIKHGATTVESLSPETNTIYGIKPTDLAEIADDIDLYRNNSLACSIHFLDDPESDEKVVLRFLNSFGFYESILLLGKQTESYTEEKGNTADIYDEVIGDYKTKTTDKKLTSQLKVNTGHLNTWRQRLTLDLLLSEEVYLKDGNNYIPVTVSAGDIDFEHIKESPESVDITIELDSEINPQ